MSRDGLLAFVASFLMLYTSCANTLVQAASSTQVPGSLTLLPPALPAGHGSDPCNFTDRGSLLSRIESDWQGYNISLLVQTCSQVCPFVYGSGNPDISGIGAMISYLLQAVTIVSFGPLLANFKIILDLEIVKPSDRIAKYYNAATDFAYNVTKTNIYVSLSIAIASVIRTFQVPSLGEHEFIILLVWLQIFIFAGAFAFFLSDQHVALATKRLFGVYSVVILALAIIGGFKGNLPSSQTQILENLTNYCVVEREFPNFPIPYQEVTEDHPSSLLLAVYSTVLLASVITGFLLPVFFKEAIQTLWSKAMDVFFAACSRFHIRPSYFTLFVFLFGMFGWVGTISMLMYFLELSRKKLQRVSGSLYEDSQWGFGQVTAVMAWAPLLHDFVSQLIDLRTGLKNEIRANAATQTLLADAAPQGSAGASIEIVNVTNVEDSADIADQPLPDAAELATTAASAHSISQSDNGTGNSESSDLRVNQTRQLANTGDAATRASDTRSLSTVMFVHSSELEDIHASQQPTRRQTTWPRNEAGTYLPVSLSSDSEQGPGPD